MSIFDGVTGLFETVFDCPVTLQIPHGADLEARGIFREEPGELTDLDGNDLLVVSPVLKVRADFAVHLSRGSLLRVQTRPGVVFEVTAVHPTRSPASDRHYLAFLTEVQGQ